MMRPVQGNEYSRPEENKASFPRRFYIYQKERFPFLGHGLLVASFSFSAIAYSRICRGADGFVPWSTYFTGIIVTITLFLLVRIFDEFKDADEDAKYRRSLPVPRGLISYRELQATGVFVVLVQVAVNLFFFPEMMPFYVLVIAYLLLMGKEFFMASWLKRNQFWYVTSHMFIIPLIDIYASGLDWYLDGAEAPAGLLFFFAVSYMNGVVLEVGRKIRTKETESAGVLTYSSMLGPGRAAALWLFILLVTCLLGIAAAAFAGYGTTGFLVLSSVCIICALPAILFLGRKSGKLAKIIEWSSALWTIAMYLTLGGIPMIHQLLSSI